MGGTGAAAITGHINNTLTKTKDTVFIMISSRKKVNEVYKKLSINSSDSVNRNGML